MRQLLVGVPVAAALLALAARPVFAQSAQQAQLRVTVVDQTGGGVPEASIRITRADGTSLDVRTDAGGVATIPGLPVGPVELHVEFPGFLSHDSTLTLRRGINNQSVTLGLAALQEEVVVTDSAAADDRRSNSMTTVLEEGDIAELSDDPDELAVQLEAMTGGAGAVFQVDGFRGGRLPNPSEIRQVRFRTSSFAADNHDAGRVQVEVITRPGLTAWSGNANFGLRNDVLNARNAFARTETPEQFRRFNMGVRGPLVRNRTSLRFNLDGNRSFDSGTIVALTPEGRVADQVRRPFEQTNLSVGLDHGLTRNSSLRLEYRRGNDDRQNLGVGDFSLMERAYWRASSEQRVRGSIQTVLGRSRLNELRVQLNARETISESVNPGVSIIVIDAFSRGDAGVSSRGNTRSLEVVDNYDFNVGKHGMRVGVLFEADNYRNFDSRNAAGTFTFGSLDAFLTGRPNTFTQRLGQVDTQFTQYQLGVYWQDDVRLHRSLSVSVGVRQEMQNHVDDQINLMPRLGFTWNVSGSRTIVRGGYGIFHDWYDSNLYDQTLRVDGRTQRDLLVLNPGYPDPIGGVSAIVLPGGRVQAAPNLRLPYIHQASIGVERPITPTLNVQASYTLMRGRNQMRSRNVNAPDVSGVRPEPNIGTVTQIESTGWTQSDRLNLNLTFRVPAKRILVNAVYTLANVKNVGDGALALPANSLDPDAEWGPASQDVRHRFNGMVNFPVWLGLRANVNTNVASAAPYTLTTGRDDNADGVSNDRPAGVGRNSERGAGRWELNARISRTFGFGGRRGGQAGGGAGGRSGGPVIMQGPGPGGAPPGAGGQQIVGGPGGGPGFGGDGANQRFSVEFYVQAFNVLNRINFVNFSGNLQSPFFGLPTSAAQARRVEVGMQFRF
ncbi:MAG TPA: carboxypeptidase-like regulatory domain-containing protein [Vicinamibacterales bacterium]